MTSVPHAFCEMYVRRCRNTNLCELEKQTKLQVCGQKKPIKLIYIIVAWSKSWWVEQKLSKTFYMTWDFICAKSPIQTANRDEYVSL